MNILIGNNIINNNNNGIQQDNSQNVNVNDNESSDKEKDLTNPNRLHKKMIDILTLFVRILKQLFELAQIILKLKLI